MNNVLDKIANRWNEHATKYDEGHTVKEDTTIWKNVIKNFIGENKDVKVVDVGTGTGFISLMLSELGYKCKGFDISEGMLSVAKKHGKEKNIDLDVSIGDLENIPIEENCVDFVTNRSVMWTLLNPIKAATEWKRILKPGGTLLCFCTVGNKMNGNHHYDEEIENMLPLKGASKEQLTDVLIQAGFKEVEIIEITEIKNNNSHAKDSKWHVLKGIK